MLNERCFGSGDELYEAYHDDEWGRPIIDERGLFERVCLEAFQIGISWRIVLHKREALRKAFADFQPDDVAGFSPARIERLLKDATLIRNRRKIEAAVANAQAVIALRDTGSSLPELIWSHRPARRRAPKAFSEVPASTPESGALATALKEAGFRLVGPITTYALMQAAGVVNDHLAGCPVRAEVEALRRSSSLPHRACRLEHEPEAAMEGGRTPQDRR